MNKELIVLLNFKQEMVVNVVACFNLDKDMQGELLSKWMYQNKDNYLLLLKELQGYL